MLCQTAAALLTGGNWELPWKGLKESSFFPVCHCFFPTFLPFYLHVPGFIQLMLVSVLEEVGTLDIELLVLPQPL